MLRPQTTSSFPQLLLFALLCTLFSTQVLAARQLNSYLPSNTQTNTINPNTGADQELNTPGKGDDKLQGNVNDLTIAVPAKPCPPGSKPDKGGDKPGNPGNAYGHNADKPGKGDDKQGGVKGESVEGPKKPCSACAGMPGKGDDKPAGNPGNAYGHYDNKPGKGDDKPGNPGNAYGHNADKPGKGDDKPGNPGNAYGHNADKPGKGDDKQGGVKGESVEGPKKPCSACAGMPGKGDDKPAGNPGNAYGHHDNKPGKGDDKQGDVKGESVEGAKGGDSKKPCPPGSKLDGSAGNAYGRDEDKPGMGGYKGPLKSRSVKGKGRGRGL